MKLQEKIIDLKWIRTNIDLVKYIQRRTITK